MSFFRRPEIRNLTPAEVADLQARGDIHLVDVREPHEWAQGHIGGAIHMPLGQVVTRFGELPSDKPVVFYCLGGGRSAQAVAACQSNGFKVDAHMAGGISAWVAHKLPVTRD